MNYIREAMRTNSNVTGTSNVPPDLIHATLGLADEVYELGVAIEQESIAHVVAEMGDLCWFIALASHALDYDPFDLPACTSAEDAPAPPELVARFISLIKKSYAYGAPLPVEELRDILAALVKGIRYVCESKMLGAEVHSFEHLLESNLAKLRRRFPGAFNSQLALVRNVTNEMEALRGTLQ